MLSIYTRLHLPALVYTCLHLSARNGYLALRGEAPFSVMGGEVYGNGRQKNQILRQEIRSPCTQLCEWQSAANCGCKCMGCVLACRQSVDGVYVKSEVVYTLKTADL